MIADQASILADSQHSDDRRSRSRSLSHDRAKKQKHRSRKQRRNSNSRSRSRSRSNPRDSFVGPGQIANSKPMTGIFSQQASQQMAPQSLYPWPGLTQQPMYFPPPGYAPQILPHSYPPVMSRGFANQPWAAALVCRNCLQVESLCRCRNFF